MEFSGKESPCAKAHGAVFLPCVLPLPKQWFATYKPTSNKIPGIPLSAPGYGMERRKIFPFSFPRVSVWVLIPFCTAPTINIVGARLGQGIHWGGTLQKCGTFPCFLLFSMDKVTEETLKPLGWLRVMFCISFLPRNVFSEGFLCLLRN